MAASASSAADQARVLDWLGQAAAGDVSKLKPTTIASDPGKKVLSFSYVHFHITDRMLKLKPDDPLIQRSLFDSAIITICGLRKGDTWITAGSTKYIAVPDAEFQLAGGNVFQWLVRQHCATMHCSCNCQQCQRYREQHVVANWPPHKVSSEEVWWSL